jgi:hypothetical protein
MGQGVRVGRSGTPNAGLADTHTLVLFTSDNGPWLSFETHGGSSGPLRAGKGTTFEALPAGSPTSVPPRRNRDFFEGNRRFRASDLAQSGTNT